MTWHTFAKELEMEQGDKVCLSAKLNQLVKESSDEGILISMREKDGLYFAKLTFTVGVKNGECCETIMDSSLENAVDKALIELQEIKSNPDTENKKITCSKCGKTVLVFDAIDKWGKVDGGIFCPECLDKILKGKIEGACNTQDNKAEKK